MGSKIRFLVATGIAAASLGAWAAEGCDIDGHMFEPGHVIRDVPPGNNLVCERSGDAYSWRGEKSGSEAKGDVDGDKALEIKAKEIWKGVDKESF